MAENRNNKFSYDRSRYERVERAVVEGSAARRLEEYAVPRRETRVQPERKVKVREKTKYNFSFLTIMMLAVSLVALVVASYRYIEARAEVTQVNKKINEAKQELQDVQNINLALQGQLDVEVDRNYIFTVAVSKLNMVYPKENNTVYYEKPTAGYVRQYQEIPAVK